MLERGWPARWPETRYMSGTQTGAAHSCPGLDAAGRGLVQAAVSSRPAGAQLRRLTDLAQGGSAAPKPEWRTRGVPD